MIRTMARSRIVLCCPLKHSQDADEAEHEGTLTAYLNCVLYSLSLARILRSFSVDEKEKGRQIGSEREGQLKTI